MGKLQVLVAAFVALAAVASAENKIVCYFGSWSVYRPDAGKFDISYIQPELCTHMIYTFVGITEQGGVKVLDEWQDLPDNYGKNGFGRFNELRQKSPGTKTLIAIGGWNEGSTKYSKVVADPTIRARFVKNVVAFLDKYNFDGFDVDWEYPAQRGGSQADVKNYILLLKELREAFSKKNYLLTAAVGAAQASASQSYDIASMSKYLHFINIMTYDLHGAWDAVTGHNAPLYPAQHETGNQRQLNVDAAVKYWISQGADPKKLILGTALYGRAFTLANANDNKVGAPRSGPGQAGPYTREAGMLGYNEICKFIKEDGWSVVWDNEQRVPYAFKDRQWVGYDNIKSIKEKAEYVKKHGLGGAMIWSIETDDFRGVCGTKYPLLKALNNVLRNGPAVTEAPIPPTAKPEVTTKKPSSPEDPEQPPSGEGVVCKSAGVLRDPKICSRFYYCVADGNGGFVAQEMNCPAGLNFDIVRKICDYPQNVKC